MISSEITKHKMVKEKTHQLIKKKANLLIYTLKMNSVAAQSVGAVEYTNFILQSG